MGHTAGSRAPGEGTEPLLTAMGVTRLSLSSGGPAASMWLGKACAATTHAILCTAGWALQAQTPLFLLLRKITGVSPEPPCLFPVGDL